MQTIESGKVVLLSFFAIDPQGKALESYSEEDPTLYLHGSENLPASFESALEGLEEGAEFDVTLEDAYGPTVDGEVHEVPRREFPKDWPLAAGFGFLAGGSAGQSQRLWVHEVRGSRIKVSAQHPWGGQPIQFKGKVLGMRNATLEERQHGHAHGPGGHHH